jgi:glycosyltransferase involved in cell wall biosynthesis
VTRRHVLLLAPQLPEVDHDGGSRDLGDLIAFLLSDGWSVTVAAQDGHSAAASRLRSAGAVVYVEEGVIPRSVLDGLEPDVVIMAYWHLAEEALPLARAVWPNARLIVSSIDLHFLRASRRVFGATSQREGARLLDRYFADHVARELNTYFAADGVFAVSSKEAELINDLTGQPGLAIHVPVTQGESMSPLGFHDRRSILFVGNFQHEPNVEAVRFLCEEVVPLLSEELLAAHPVLIVGHAPDDRVVRSVTATPGVQLVGWVPSLTPYFHSARVSVAPLLHGAGVKGKIVRSLAAGTPVVSTTLGIEGLELDEGDGVLVADDPSLFAESIVALTRDAELWSAQSAGGRQHVVRNHAPDIVRARVTSAIETIRGRSPKPEAIAALLAQSRSSSSYEELKQSVAELVSAVVAPSERVLVISKGDEGLLDLGAIRGSHFPQTIDGDPMTWHPAQCEEILAGLDDERARGHHCLVLPHTSYWWLEHYDGLTPYLDEHYELRSRDDHTCIVWSSKSATALRTSRRDMPRVVVSGAVASKPFNGGNAVTRLAWMDGFRGIGVDAWFLEQMLGPTDDLGIAWLARLAARHGIADRVVVLDAAGEVVFGPSAAVLDDVLAGTDVLLNISGHLAADRLAGFSPLTVFLDDDPGFTQAWEAAGSAGSRLADHDVYLTYGANIGDSGCPIPTVGRQWHAVLPPVNLDRWVPEPAPARTRFTTVGTWRGPFGGVEIDGVAYGLKLHEFRKVLELPLRVDADFAMAMDVHPDEVDDLSAISAGGWQLVAPDAVAEPSSYHAWIQASSAEFSAAQGVYVGTRSGWVSDRTACYLASGRPALVQDTGQAGALPVGEGLLTYMSLEDATESAASIIADHDRHAKAARAVAEGHLDARQIARYVLDLAGSVR